MDTLLRLISTQYIPRGHRSHPREIVGATFLTNQWSNRSEWISNGDPFVRFFSIRFLIAFYSKIRCGEKGNRC